MNLEKATAILAGVDWQHDDRPFTPDERNAICWATVEYVKGRLPAITYAKLLGDIPQELLPPPWVS